VTSPVSSGVTMKRSSEGERCIEEADEEEVEVRRDEAAGEDIVRCIFQWSAKGRIRKVGKEWVLFRFPKRSLNHLSRRGFHIVSRGKQQAPVSKTSWCGCGLGEVMSEFVLCQRVAIIGENMFRFP
jgi:hypothetical protein